MFRLAVLLLFTFTLLTDALTHGSCLFGVEELLKVMGITTLPIINEIGPLLNSTNFPNNPCVIRGPEGNTVCCLKSEVSRELNLGNVNFYQFRMEL